MLMLLLAQVDELFREIYGDATARHDQLLEGAAALGPPAALPAASSGAVDEAPVSATAGPSGQAERGGGDGGDGPASLANILDGSVRRGLNARLDPAAGGAPGAVSESLAQTGVLSSARLSHCVPISSVCLRQGGIPPEVYAMAPYLHTRVSMLCDYIDEMSFPCSKVQGPLRTK